MDLRGLIIGFVAGAMATMLVVAGAATLKARSQPTMFGHRAFAVADPSTLVDLDPEGKARLRRVAAKNFFLMQAAAKTAGLWLVPVSGYRDLERQKSLFFEGAAERGETVAERAHVCAPPGFSEHHTGLAVDVGDGEHREGQLQLTFAETPAFRWMKENAAKFHFEMSFPEGNAEGVAYEPWHWRFVGTLASFRTFYPAGPAGVLTALFGGEGATVPSAAKAH